MSLHNLAKHIQSQGRKGDSGLVHMTPGEIKGLQSLALAHGGSLTINPETGLPEASFLKWLIPALAIAAAPFTGGMSLGAAAGAAGTAGALTAGTAAAAAAGAGTAALTAPIVAGGLTAGMAAPSMLAATTALSSPLYAGGAALATGAAEGIAEKNLVKGLTAGIGAYSGLTSLGTLGALGNAAATAAPAVTTVGKQGSTLAAENAAQNALAIDPSAMLNSTTGQLYNPTLATDPSAVFNSATGQLQTAAPQALAKALTTDRSAMLNSTTGQLYNPSYASTAIGAPYAPDAVPSWSFDTFGTNFGNTSTWDKAKLAAGIGLPLYNAMSDTGSTPKKPESTTTKYEGPYKPVPRTAQFQTSPTFYTDSSEHQYFDDVNPYPGSMPYPGAQAAQGGLMSLAEGGEVASQNSPLMAAPNLTAIQNYLSGIGAQPQTQPQQPGQSMDFSAIQNYIAGIGQQQPRQQIQIPQAPSIQPQIPIAQNQEYNYGFKPIEAIIPPPPPPKPKYNSGRSQNAKGGLTSLANNSRFLEGPGTGLSDDIHTSIEGVQPARLADGEYVVSADVVSALGGGSSKAGAKKLKDMMDRVRQSAHGTKKQIKKINDRHVLPA